jgi:hypothetical protein
MEGPNIISYAKEKAEVWNDNFCSQSSIDDGAATIPNDIISFHTVFWYFVKRDCY